MTSAARYFWVFLATSGVLIGSILALNLLLGERALGGPESTRQASEWQQQRQGVTYAPPITASRRFKALRLADRLPEIDTLVFGSSTAWGIASEAIPSGYRMYNFATTGNPLASIIGEAQYLLERHPGHFRLMVIPLEWAIGSLFDTVSASTADLSPQAALATTGNIESITLWRKINDALAYPKVVNLFRTIRSIARSANPGVAVSIFLAPAGPEYQCTDGALARDFDVVNQGKCVGFRYDGSWSFGGEKRLSPEQAAVLARAAAAPSSKFSRSLCSTEGEPNPEYLQALAAISRQLAGEKGQALFIMPPLVPGFEVAMTRDAPGRECLVRTKAALQQWAVLTQVVVIDAGRSEHYGCAPSEFIDEHHAYPECYRRILDRFFQSLQEGLVKPGLFQP